MKNFIFSEALSNSRIIRFCRTCDLIMITFKTADNKEIYLHAQCFVRVFDADNTLVICSNNMLYSSPKYQFKKYERFDWTRVGSTLFDDSLEDYKDKIFSTKILNLNFDNHDIRIKLKMGCAWIF